MTDRPTDAPCQLLIEALPDGAVLTDAAIPCGNVLYANRAFESLTGFSAAQMLGSSLPLLDGAQRGTNGLQRVRDGIRAGIETRAVVCCRHRDGSPLVLDAHAVPLRDADGRVAHWACIFRRAETRAAPETAQAECPWPAAARQFERRDALTGLASRARLEAALQAPVTQPANRGGPTAAVFVADVDDLCGYNDTFGRAAGDAMLKRVGAALGAAFRRSSDILARWDGGTFAAATQGMEAARIQAHAESLRTRVRGLGIHHPHSRSGKFVSVTIAVATAPVGDCVAPVELLEQALASLRDAKAAIQPALAAPRRAAQ